MPSQTSVCLLSSERIPSLKGQRCGNLFCMQPSKTFQSHKVQVLGSTTGFASLCRGIKGKKKVSKKPDLPYIQFHTEGQKPSVFFLKHEWQRCLFNLVPIFEALNTLKCPFVPSTHLCRSTLHFVLSNLLVVLFKHMFKADKFRKEAINIWMTPHRGWNCIAYSSLLLRCFEHHMQRGWTGFKMQINAPESPCHVWVGLCEKNLHHNSIMIPLGLNGSYQVNASDALKAPYYPKFSLPHFF